MTIKNITKTFLILTTLLIDLIPINSYAEESNKFESIYDSCIKKAGGINNSVVATCSAASSEAAKKEMNRLYDIIHKNISEDSKEDAQKFEDSQKAWIKYRNNHCQLMGSYVGSPMYGYCPMKLNIARVLELKELANE
ncbi:lysozyme inhibitor LprI family protein [Thiofilum flexile]|uniref:lysozyme inhibitor LprI family protein n=1 Tax=Thiofilum flexile TaxID=125627 RepID=UPI000379B1A9|nr:lysozyme inhibitor LprI family protein [Thiofilum flexile]